MYFILSKVLFFLILPLNWILASFIIALIAKDKKRKKRFFIAGFVILVLFTNPFLLDIFARYWNVRPVALPQKQYSCAIILGGFSGADVKGNGYFGYQADRFIQGAKLKASGKVSHLLISGGDGNVVKTHFAESDWAKQQYEGLNFQDTSIISEPNSRNTFENAAFTKTLLIKNHLAPPYVLITSAAHMRRSIMIFKKAGIEVVPISCNYMAGLEAITFRDFEPNAFQLFAWQLYIKEFVGWITTSLIN